MKRRSVPSGQTTVRQPKTAPWMGQAFAMAVECQNSGMLEQAKQLYGRILQHQPQHDAALHNLGRIACQMGDLGFAAELCQRAIAANPHQPEYHTTLGVTLAQAGDYERAQCAFRAALRIDPNCVNALYNFGNLFQRQESWQEAMRHFERALELQPNHPHARNNLGNAYRSAGRLADAVACLEKAIEQQPASAVPLVNLAGVVLVVGNFKRAEELLRRATALQPGFSVAHQNLLFALHYDSTLDLKTLAAEHRIWAARHADPLLPPGRRHANAPDPERRIRVGYVSADLRRHPITTWIEAVLAGHDPHQVEVVCYAGGKADSWTARIRPHADLWRETIGLGDAELARQIELDQIDILVDLSGHTLGNRLLAFARKPAPVQVTWMAYFNTTGMAAMDYILVDPYLAPPGEDAPFVEEPVSIEGCMATYSIPPHVPAVAPSPCLARGFTTYGCFNALSKVGFHMVPLWAEVLRRDPASRLVMKNHCFSDESTREMYRKQFSDYGIACERLDLLGPSSYEEYLQAYAEVDVALDPFPYTGGTTTCDALMMGVPVVTRYGDRFVSRIASTILSNAGLGELVTHSREEYIEKAIALGQEPLALASLRASMREKLAGSNLCDTAGFVRKLESAYRTMWRRWCAGQKPWQAEGLPHHAHDTPGRISI